MDYRKLVISPENKEEEDKILVEIYDCIKKSESLVFDAGAGSGKTYSLIETLKYIIAEYGKNMKVHNQKIMCITYTNVAANEIKERLGNTSLVSVGTIHENLWEIIKTYQKQLIQIHKYNLMDEIEKMEEDVKTNAKYEKYRNLSQKEQEKLIQTIYENIEEYYKNKKAEKFREVFSPILNNYGILKDDILKNVGNFKYVINNLIKINKYKETVEKIDLKDVKFINIEYDVRSSNDKLEKMKINHDTLLLYSYKIIEQNDLLKQFIIDMYPFILIDEYQDTNPKVIKLLNCLDSYSRKINHDLFLGYFGDVKQNIYEKGVGKELFAICSQLKRIKKVYNRRSAPEIIEVANKIRNDDINQKTIYSNFPKGTVSFYNMDIDKKEFIDIHVEKWNITKKNKLHCLELTNKFIVEQLGFEDIYSFFEKAPWYKIGKRFELLKEHLLNSEITKIGEVQNLLFKIVDLRNKLKCRGSMISEIFEKRTLKNCTWSDLKSTINKLKNIDAKTLKAYILKLLKGYNKGDELYDKCLDNYILSDEFKSYDEIKQYILNEIFIINIHEESEETIEEHLQKIEDFFNIDIKKIDLWYEYVTNKIKGNIAYHTYHGTKGLEFDNVILFLQPSFAKNKEYFINLFETILLNDNDEKIEDARNLLYVATTRATLNLSILYSEDISSFEENVKKIFGEIKTKI